MATRRRSQGSIAATQTQALPANLPPAPVPTRGPQNWPHRALYDRVISTLYALPERFETTLRIEGVPAPDLFTMNSALGAAIEKSVVDSLNELRTMWDPEQEYADYAFVRQSQRFPDVLLRTSNPNPRHPQIILGLELKGWFLLSKEGEPSFRYKISPQCCAEADLLVVLPWIFDSVVSGKPRLLDPIITEAAYAAKRRNYHWEWLRANPTGESQDRRGINLASHSGTYPPKSAKSSDVPISDNSGNFGRVARCGAIDADVDARLAAEILGIPADSWRRFLLVFADGATPTAMADGLSGLARLLDTAGLTAAQRESAADLLQQLSWLLRGGATEVVDSAA
jgi:hypothetical protein